MPETEARRLADRYRKIRFEGVDPETGQKYTTEEEKRQAAIRLLEEVRKRAFERFQRETEAQTEPAQTTQSPEEVADAIREFFVPSTRATPDSIFATQAREGAPLPPTGVDSIFATRAREGYTPPLPSTTSFWPQAGFMTERREGQPLMSPTPRPIRRTRTRASTTTAPNDLIATIRTARILRDMMNRKFTPVGV